MTSASVAYSGVCVVRSASYTSSTCTLTAGVLIEASDLCRVTPVASQDLLASYMHR